MLKMMLMQLIYKGMEEGGGRGKGSAIPVYSVARHTKTVIKPDKYCTANAFSFRKMRQTNLLTVCKPCKYCKTVTVWAQVPDLPSQVAIKEMIIIASHDYIAVV